MESQALLEKIVAVGQVIAEDIMGKIIRKGLVIEPHERFIGVICAVYPQLSREEVENGLKDLAEKGILKSGYYCPTSQELSLETDKIPSQGERSVYFLPVEQFPEEYRF
ncbi:MAG TPA: hypothetical protein VJ208_02815 [Candidatus Nanoarchaeia archaeon]|nr:hypothetical protein [Candidatus Nanoarchaeia archaeon]